MKKIKDKLGVILLYAGVLIWAATILIAENTLTGTGAGNSLTTGYDNNLSGERAGYNLTTGNNNHFSGFYSGYWATTAKRNVFLGYMSGYYLTTEEDSLLISNSPVNNLITGNFAGKRIWLNGDVNFGDDGEYFKTETISFGADALVGSNAPTVTAGTTGSYALCDGSTDADFRWVVNVPKEYKNNTPILVDFGWFPIEVLTGGVAIDEQSWGVAFQVVYVAVNPDSTDTVNDSSSTSNIFDNGAVSYGGQSAAFGFLVSTDGSMDGNFTGGDTILMTLSRDADAVYDDYPSSIGISMVRIKYLCDKIGEGE